MTNRQQRFLHTGDFVHKRHVGQGGQLIDLFLTFFFGGGVLMVLNYWFVLYHGITLASMVDKSEWQNLKCITVWTGVEFKNFSVCISIFYCFYSVQQKCSTENCLSLKQGWWKLALCIVIPVLNFFVCGFSLYSINYRY